MISFYLKSGLLTVLLASISILAFAAEEKGIALVKGYVVDKGSGEPVPGILVTISYLKRMTVSDSAGMFSFREVPYGRYRLMLGGGNAVADTIRIVVAREIVDLGTIDVVMKETDGFIQEVQIPVVLLDERNLSSDDDGISAKNISGLLTTSRDPFQHVATFTFGSYRFQPRGYGLNMQQVSVNGIPMNDIETGDIYWSQWGGLNDIFRSRNAVYGSGLSDAAFGGINGAVDLDVTAAGQQRQTRVTYSFSDRLYRNRLMLTHNSGLQKGGWAYAMSASRRWAKEGYIPGTFYDGYSYYAGVTKLFGKKHQLDLIAFGAPVRRGKAAPAIEEVYDLTGNKLYNPNWGYQDGKKRNARIADYFQPVFILSYLFSPTSNTHWYTSFGYQSGKNANSSLDWYNGADPRPDYYRYLPSWKYELYNTDSALASQEADKTAEQWKANASIRQIDWNRLYQVNHGNYEMISNVNGTLGNNVYGRRSVYILGSDVDAVKKYSFNTYLRHVLTDHITLYEGVTFLSQRTESYKRLDDLLGGDFYLNLNQFAEREYPGNVQTGQNDLETPGRIVKAGDRYGYSYLSYFTKSWIWAQAAGTYNKIDLFAAVCGGVNSFRREGLFRNGLYPDNSLGASPVQKFFLYAVKAGVTYKINGRNYLFANGMIAQDAPAFDNIYISPRTRNQTVGDPSEQKTYTAEGGYLLRAPRLNGRLVGYNTDVRGATEIKRFYNGDPQFQSFVNLAMEQMSMRFTGMEIGLDYKLSRSVNLTGVAATGQAFYTSNPLISIYRDNDTAVTVVSRKAYISNYHFASGPRSAYFLGVKYRSRHYWFGTISFSYFDNNYMDIAPDRRTGAAVSTSIPGSEQWHKILDQQKLPPFFTVDLFIYKSILLSRSFRFLPKNTFLYLSLGINNLLDNRNIVTGGFEQLRYDFSGGPDKFPPKYFNGFGRNYFANLSLKL